MIECPECDFAYQSVSKRCDSCGFSPAIIDGFEAWAPELSNQSTGDFFNQDSFQNLVKVESQNFWFRIRNQLIIWAIRRYCDKPDKYAEIGCGTGFVLSAIADKFPQSKLLGSEMFVRGLQYAALRVPSAKLVQMDARKIPYLHEFNVMGAFDVLEHIEDDISVLRGINKALVAGGYIILTVPQHEWLWSWTDDAACHVRRYASNELHSKLESSGFELVRSTSFITLLLPLMIISRLSGRDSPREPFAEFRIPLWINRLFEFVLKVELMLIRLNIDMPAGGSRLVVARKKCDL